MCVCVCVYIERERERERIKRREMKLNAKIVHANKWTPDIGAVGDKLILHIIIIERGVLHSWPSTRLSKSYCGLENCPVQTFSNYRIL